MLLDVLQMIDADNFYEPIDSIGSITENLRQYRKSLIIAV